MYEPVGVPMDVTKDSDSAELKKELSEWTENELQAYS